MGEPKLTSLHLWSSGSSFLWQALQPKPYAPWARLQAIASGFCLFARDAGCLEFHVLDSRRIWFLVPSPSLWSRFSLTRVRSNRIPSSFLLRHERRHRRFSDPPRRREEKVRRKGTKDMVWSDRLGLYLCVCWVSRCESRVWDCGRSVVRIM